MLAAGASALAGFFIGGKLPQLEADEIEVAPLKHSAGTGKPMVPAAYTIPIKGKIPNKVIWGDKIETPLYPLTLERFGDLIVRAGSEEEIIAANAGQRLGWLVNDTCKHMVVDGLKKRFITLPAGEENYTTHKLVQQSVDIGLEYMREKRYDVITHAFQSLVDGIIERCNDDPHQCVDPLYISFYYDGYGVAHTKKLFTLRGCVWLVNV
jgi:hypothetical protein